MLKKEKGEESDQGNLLTCIFSTFRVNMKFQMHPINLPAKWLTQSMSLLIM
jgi:hypothetical protein